MRRALGVLAAILAVAGVMSAASPARAIDCGVPTPYPTISLAVGDANCTRILVSPGDYAETISIERDLELVGPNASVPGTGARSSEANITGTGDGFVVRGPASV